MASIHELVVAAGDGSDVRLDAYADRVLLIVNVASRCGLTPQYEGLEALHRDLAERGLVVLGFPCNQFGGQEPGTQEEIQDFCSTTYGVGFPIMGKVEVNGPDADPLFVHLRAAAPGSFGPDAGRLYDHVERTRPEALGTDEVKWNFTKFLVGRDGEVVRRYEPYVTPEEIRADLEAVLG
jgi:glutathione peroxidase